MSLEVVPFVEIQHLLVKYFCNKMNDSYYLISLHAKPSHIYADITWKGGSSSV